MNCLICLFSPNIKQDFDLHHVVYHFHNHLNHIPPTPLIYTNLKPMRPRPEKDKLNLVKKGGSRTRSSDALSPNTEFFLTINYLTLGYSCPKLPSFILNNKMTIHMDTHAFLITQKKEALDFLK
jgi:hypothetical protein